MLTIHVWPKWLKDFLLTHPLYKSPNAFGFSRGFRLQSVLTVGWRPRFIRFNPPTVGELKRSMPKNASAMQARHLALISGGYLLTRIV